MLKLNTSNEILDAKEEIRKVYLETKAIPWVIGYSGGKDSSVVLQLVVNTLIELEQDGKICKDVYVISSDTLVENPLVQIKATNSIANILKFSKSKRLRLHASMVYPKQDESFFVNVIGRGYPVPNQSFRWCTDRLKINPANNFIKSKIDTFGEVIMLLGTRSAESISRKKSMDKHKIKDYELSVHTTLENAWTYAPIAKLSVDDVWEYLLTNPCPWGEDNSELYKMYADSSQGECPLVIDGDTKKTDSCGNSRFGCWSCTVVSEDKSLTGFIESGESWLKLLLDYRNMLVQIRDENTKRSLFDNRGNLKLVDLIIDEDGNFKIAAKNSRKEFLGNINTPKNFNLFTDIDAFTDFLNEGCDIDPRIYPCIIENHGDYKRIGVSGFSFPTRVDLLKELLTIQVKVDKTGNNYNVINEHEIIEINRLWKEMGYLDNSAIDIYEDICGISLEKEDIISLEDYELLSSIAIENEFNEQVMFSIIQDSSNYIGIKNRADAKKRVVSQLEKHMLMIDWKNNGN